MDLIRQIAMYLGASTVLVVFVLGLGAAVTMPVLRSIDRVDRVDRVATFAAAGSAVAVIAPTLWAYRESRIVPLGVAMVLLSLAGLVGWGWSAARDAADRRAAGSTLARAAATIGGAGGVAMLQYRQVFTSGYLPHSLTAFTNFNNDLAIYVLQSDNIRAVGFGELGRTADLFVGNWAKGDHTGASALAALLSFVLRVPAWQAAMAVLVAAVALTVLVLVGIARAIGIERRPLAWAAAAWAVCAPFPASIQSNYFLGQIVSRMLLCSLVLVIVRFALAPAPRRRSTDVLHLVMIVSLVSAGLLAYPAGHLAAMVVAGLLAVGFVAAAPELSSWRDRARRLGAIGAATMMGALTLLPRRQMIIDSVRLYSKENVTGFPLQTLDVRVLLGVPGSRTAGLSVAAVVAIAVLVALAVTGLVLGLGGRRQCSAEFGVVLVVAPAVLYLFVVLRDRTDAYQAWKTLGSVQPFAILGVSAMAVSGLDALLRRLRDTPWTVRLSARRRQATLTVLVACPVAALLSWVVLGAQEQWTAPVSSRAIFDGRHVRPEVSGLGGSALVRAQTGLRVALSPYFETMVAAAAANLYDVHWGSDTYLGAASTAGTCVLMPADAPLPDGATGPPIVVGAGLVLVPVPTCAGLTGP